MYIFTHLLKYLTKFSFDFDLQFIAYFLYFYLLGWNEDFLLIKKEITDFSRFFTHFKKFPVVMSFAQRQFFRCS